MNITQTLSEPGRKPTGPLGWVIALLMPMIFRSLYRKVAIRLDLRTDDEVLDVGCGSGDFLKRHAVRARRITGIDHSAVEITMARWRNRRRIEQGSAEFVQGDAGALPWSDDSFTAVTCNCVQCFADPQRSLQEMCRVLVPDGRAVLVMQGRASHPGDHDRFGMPLWSEAELRQMTADAGFCPVTLAVDDDMWFVTAQKRHRHPGAPDEAGGQPAERAALPG